MQAAPNPVFANVAVLRIPDFDAKPVAEQAASREALERAAREALSGMAAGERIVLDAGDGLAVVLFGEPARALQLAEAVTASRGSAVQSGVNHGPLALTSRGSDARVFGDGLATAFAAARFAPPGKVLVTQEFARMLGYRNPERAAELATAGEFTDTRVRQHTFFSPDAKRGARHRRRMVLYGIAGVAAILLLGVAARQARVRLFPPAPAVVTFQVKPRGEVIVDGVVRGRIPAVKEIELPEGRHVIQIRLANAAPYEVTLDLKAGERRNIAHTFVVKPPPEPPKPDFWRDLRKKFS